MMELHVVAMKQVGAYKGEGPWNDDLIDIENHYLNAGGDFLVGEIDGTIVAMGAFRKDRDGFAEVKRMRVDPDFQGRCYGKQILKELEKRARVSGYKGFILETSEVQKSARALYQQDGFVPIRDEIIDGYACTWYRKIFR